jgi:hypothetical protein
VYLEDPSAWETYFKNNISFFREYDTSIPDSYPCIIVHKVVDTSYKAYSVHTFVYPIDFYYDFD